MCSLMQTQLCLPLENKNAFFFLKQILKAIRNVFLADEFSVSCICLAGYR